VTVIQASRDPNVYSSSIVLKPKLRAPMPRPEQLDRPRLLELLGESLHRRLTLISAPAGYGKTTLLAQWSEADKDSVLFAWVSLDEQDNDPVRLGRHILEALRQVAPEEDFGTDVLVGMSVARQRFIETSGPMLINELAELPQRVVLILDDYHCITKDDSHESVAFFAEHLPENVHLVLASRSDPPLPLGRLRARAEMNEIRTEQLAFSEEEAATLLNEKMGLDIDPDDLSVLFARTEGWPAAIYLASLSLQKREDKHAFIESFGGSNRYVVDLLGEEVMTNLPQEEREFLLKISVLRSMTGSLCDAVTGGEGSGKLLSELARSNLFLVPLDEQGEWYRYHQLFSEFLLYELKNSRPDLVPILHGRASVWAEGAGFLDAAVQQAIAATDYGRAGMLAARHWFRYVSAGQTKTVQSWLDSLPEELTTHDAALLLVKAWTCILSGQSEEAERLLTLVESIPCEGPLPDGTTSVEAGVATIRAVFGLGGVNSTLRDAQNAAKLDRELTSPWAALIRFGLGSNLYLSGEKSLARKQFEETLELTETGQPLLRMVSLSFLAIVAADEGQLEEAGLLAREARSLVDRFRLHEVPQSSWAPIALGYVLAKRGDMDEAQTELERGLSTRRTLPDLSPWPTLIALLALAPVRSARGDRSGARAALAEARSILEMAPDAGILPDLLDRQERKLRARRPQEGHLDGELTGRELEVLRLLGGELSASQIAQSLYVAASTVRTQVKSIYRKLGVSSRSEAVEEAHARGLI
jgi:LuxR family transcriptional regulator, maltose regulon positive regulatory protein